MPIPLAPTMIIPLFVRLALLPVAIRPPPKSPTAIVPLLASMPLLPRMIIAGVSALPMIAPVFVSCRLSPRAIMPPVPKLNDAPTLMVPELTALPRVKMPAPLMPAVIVPLFRMIEPPPAVMPVAAVADGDRPGIDGRAEIAGQDAGATAAAC